jgi:hypothetical protein
MKIRFEDYSRTSEAEVVREISGDSLESYSNNPLGIFKLVKQVAEFIGPDRGIVLVDDDGEDLDSYSM